MIILALEIVFKDKILCLVDENLSQINHMSEKHEVPFLA